MAFGIVTYVCMYTLVMYTGKYGCHRILNNGYEDEFPRIIN